MDVYQHESGGGVFAQRSAHGVCRSVGPNQPRRSRRIALTLSESRQLLYSGIARIFSAAFHRCQAVFA